MNRSIEKIISDYQVTLRAFLMSRMRNPSDVDDVLQDALTKTFRNLHTLKSDEKLRPWLFQIASNALMDHYRRRRRDDSVTAEDLWYGDMDASDGHAFEGCVDIFLEGLDDDSADLMRAIELQGMSQKDYAEKHGISYSTIKSRVQASRKKLRQMFEQCCDIAFAADGSVMEYTRKSTGCDDCT